MWIRNVNGMDIEMYLKDEVDIGMYHVDEVIIEVYPMDEVGPRPGCPDANIISTMGLRFQRGGAGLGKNR